MISCWVDDEKVQRVFLVCEILKGRGGWTKPPAEMITIRITE